MNEQLRGIIAETLRLAPQSITDDISPHTSRSWDSHATVELILALEQKFGLIFSIEELSEMTSVGAIRRVLSSRGVKE